MGDDFVHLHVHSEYSLLDGLGTTGALAKRAAALGQPALALTDHGVMHGAIEFVRGCRAANIKPILGVEAYLTTFGRPKEGRDPELDRSRYHLLLLAENMTGYRNLLQICSDAQLDGYYYRPRIDAAYLEKHAEGLICTSGCLAAELPTLLKTGREAKALERLQWYRDLFGKDRWYVEFQEHDIPELTQVNKQLFAFANKYDIPMVVTNDVHYVREEDAKPHDMLLCVQTSSLVSQQDRMRMSSASYFLKTAEQMRQTFLPLADLPDSAFTNTLKIAEMCNVDPEDETYHLPDIPIPEGYTYESYLRQMTEEGVRRRYADRADDPAVRARVEHELKIIHEMGFDIYYLIVWDLTFYAQRRGIWYNVRGSGAGSIVAYAIGITNLDPLRNKLIFERFLNPGRVTMPDFDLDFPDDQREELIRYTVDKYGSDRVAQIVTFGRMKARAAVRDVGRAMDVPLADVDRIAKMIPAIPGKPVTIQDVLTEGHEFYSAELKELYQGEDYVKNLLDSAGQLEGVARHSSIHAAAVIIADKPLVNYTPLMRPPKSAVTDKVTQYEFPILESIGLLKVDFLGLATLSLMREATRLIKERRGIELGLDTIPIDDPKIYELLSSGDVIGVFQVEGAGMRRLCMDLRPSEFDHITAIIALYRPGPMDFIPDFIAVLHGEKKPEYVHPALEPILAETMAVCVYQEQVIQILTDIAGYTAGEADLVRRGISKKKKSVLEQHREIFAKGAAEKSGISRADADAIWDALMGFARYGFNRAHAADYAVIVAQTAYLKAYYPVEYLAALLTIERHDTEKVALLIAECRRMGIEVLPPSVNLSSNSFTIEALPADRVAPRQLTAFPFPIGERAAIRMGLDAIKNVGEGPVATLLEARGREAFASLSDFAERVDLRQINRRGLECLIKVGALDMFADRGRLMAGIDRIMSTSANSHEAAEIGQLTLFGGDELGGSEDLLSGLPDAARISGKEALTWEKELIGVYVSSHPLQTMTVDLVNVVTHTSGDITEELNKVSVVLAGMIMDVRTITTKKGDTMAFVRLEDLQGQVEVTVFPRLWEQTKAVWLVDKIVIVRGKVDVRNGRAGVLADSVQDYVPNVQVIEDQTSVAYRARQGSLGGRPELRQSAPRYTPPSAASRYGLPSGRGEAEEGDEDAGFDGEVSPFAGEEPDWLASAPRGFGGAEREPRDEEGGSTPRPPAAPGAGPARPAGNGGATPQAADGKPAPARDPNGGAPRSPSVSPPPATNGGRVANGKPGETSAPPAAATGSAPSRPAGPDGDGGSALPATGWQEPAAVPPSATSPHPSVVELPGHRTLRITFRRSSSLDADRRRLAALVETLGRYPGQDRFEIIVEAAGIARYQLDFPNNFTGFCAKLENELTEHVGPGGWRAE
ncbi:MAG TPA: DNA polymerase III subunit alpha [Anaerolineae bacterium]